MSYTTLELVRFTINKLNHCHNLSVSKRSFIGQPLWLRSVRHACVIFFLFCASGFSLLSLKHGSNSGMDDRSRFGSFPRRQLLFAGILLPNNSALPAIFITLTELYEERRRVTHTTGYLITVTMFQLSTSSLFAATAIFIPIRVHKIVIGIWELAVRGATWRMQILGQMYLSFTPTQGVGWQNWSARTGNCYLSIWPHGIYGDSFGLFYFG